MSSRSPLLLLVVLTAPLAAAHDDPAAPYDPLRLDWHAFLTAEGGIVGVPPAAGAVAFAPTPVPPVAAAPGVQFSFLSPVAFEPGAGFRLTLVLRVDKPLVTADASIEALVAPGGDPVRAPIPGGPVLAPGTVATVELQLQAPGALYEQGANVTLIVRPFVSALPEDALSIVVGGEGGSRFDALDMRVPAPIDLRLQDLPHTEIILGEDQFVPPATHAVNVFSVLHDAVTPPLAGEWSDAGTYVLLRGEEDDAAARSHALVDEDARRAAAHLFRVNGAPVRVHPGLGVIVRVPSLPIRVVCEANCPQGGFSWSYAPTTAGTGASGEDAPSILVPPPRDTSGIPVSEDEPAEKATPFPTMTALVAAFALALLLRRTKR